MAGGYVLGIEARESVERTDVTVTPRMKTILERAARIAAARTGLQFIGTENVLRAMTDDKDGIASLVLSELGVLDRVRDRLDEIMGSPSYVTPARGPRQSS